MRGTYPLPLTWRVFRGLHISNPLVMNLFGAMTGALLRMAKPRRYRKIRDMWNEHKPDSSDKEWRNYLGCYMIYGVLPDEYLCFRFSQLNDKGRREFITEFSRYRIYDACNDPAARHFFDNKYETYTLLKVYYGRDAILIDGNTPEDTIKQFARAHTRFIIKPLRLYCGMGVEIIDSAHYASPDAMISYVKGKGDCIAEELICQTEDVALFHGPSVNTVRIPAFRTNEGVRILTPQFKAGTGNNIVDNAFAGGLLAAVDSRSGIVMTPAVNVKGQEFLKHPDTGAVFPGFQLPEWDKALALIDKLMLAKPEIRFVGWDLAHTSKGWIVVEGNHEGQFCSQMPLHTGYAREVEEILKKIT